MAQKKQIALRKQALVTQLAGSRQAISNEKAALKGHLQVKKQIRTLALKKPKALFVGSLAAGLLVTLLLKRPRKAKKSALTSKQMILAWGLALLKPAAKSWLVSRAKGIAANQIATRSI